MSQYVAVCRSVSQCVAVCCSVLQCVAVRCSVLQGDAVCCSVLQFVAVCRKVTPFTARRAAASCGLEFVPHSSRHAATHCSTLQHTAPHCNTLATHVHLQHTLHLEFVTHSSRHAHQRVVSSLCTRTNNRVMRPLAFVHPSLSYVYHNSFVCVRHIMFKYARLGHLFCMGWLWLVGSIKL